MLLRYMRAKHAAIVCQAQNHCIHSKRGLQTPSDGVIRPASSHRFAMVSRTVHEVAGFVGMVVAAGFIALYAVLGKILLTRSFDPMVFLAHRQALASVVMLPIAWCKDGMRCPQRSQLVRLGTLSFLFTANIAGFIAGLALTNAFSVIMMQLTIPCMSLLLDWAITRKRPRCEAFLWTIVTTAGCIAAVVGTHTAHRALAKSTRGTHHAVAEAAGRQLARGAAHHLLPRLSMRFMLGMGVLFAQCLSFALFVLVQKSLLEDAPAFSIVSWTHPGSAVLCLVIGAVTGPPERLWDLASYSYSDGCILVFAALCGTVGSFLLMAYATKWLPASLVSTIFTALEPVWVSLIQWVLLDEALTPLAIFGDCLATVGVGMLGRLQYLQSQATQTVETDKLLTEPSGRGADEGSNLLEDAADAHGTSGSPVSPLKSP